MQGRNYVILRAIMNKESIQKEWSKFGQNPQNLIWQTKDFLTKLEFFKERLVFWFWDTRNRWTCKSWRIWTRVPFLNWDTNTENKNITKPSITASMLTQEDRKNVELIKKIMREKKTTLPSLRNQDRKNVKVETEKLNKLLTNIPAGNINKLNELISHTNFIPDY